MNKKVLTGMLLMALVAMTASEASAQGSRVYRVGYSKGGPVQSFKGGPVQSCGCEAKSKGCGKDACGSCCPGILPALVSGVGNLLESVFRCCDPCNTGCGKSCGGIAQKCGGTKYRTPKTCAPLFSRRCGVESKCGCGVGGGGTYYQGPSAPADPFIDDELAPPPVPTSEARLRSTRAPLHHAATYVRPKLSKPAKTITASHAQKVHVTNALKKVEHTAPTLTKVEAAGVELDSPSNPLR